MNSSVILIAAAAVVIAVTVLVALAYEWLKRLILPDDLDVFPYHVEYSEKLWQIIRWMDEFSRDMESLILPAYRAAAKIGSLSELLTTGYRDGEA